MFVNEISGEKNYLKRLFINLFVYMKDSEIGPVPQTCPIIL
jgi:hypothetical protein